MWQEIPRGRETNFACAYQFFNLALQVVDAVQLPLTTASRCDAVFAASSHVMHKVQLLPCQTLKLQHLLEVIAAQRCNPLHREWELWANHGAEQRQRTETGTRRENSSMIKRAMFTTKLSSTVVTHHWVL